MSKTCDDCRYALFIDSGYSNYTVEGTEFFCLRNLHPEKNGFDRWYGEDERLKFADTCVAFSDGDPVAVDVGREALSSRSDPLSSGYTLDPEIKSLLDAWEQE